MPLADFLQGGVLAGSPNFEPTFGQRLGAGLKNFAGNRDLALALLANSGYGPKQSFGQALGNSMMQADQMKQGREDDAFKRQYMTAQMARMNQNSSAFGAVDPSKFTIESLGRFQKSGNYADLEAKPFTMGIGKINPGQYTPESFAAYQESGDINDLVRYVAPQNAVVTKVNGGSVVVTPNRNGAAPTVNPLSTAQSETDAAAAQAAAEAQAKAEGDAAGAQSGKAPAKASMDYVLGEFDKQIKKTPQGGLFGYKGKSGTVTSKAEKETFNNLREQLSTELRTVFRIPGEGSLSDKEQAQYGVQLPSTDYEPETNAKILQDLRERTRLRTETQIGKPDMRNAKLPAAPPAVGTVKGGYRFKGGNPADPKSWVKVQ